MRRSYRDRAEAGGVLAVEVAPLVRGPAVVAGIPRGGIVVAAPVAAALHAPLTLAFVRKLALPQAPELAVGALDEDGHAIVDHRIVASIHGTPEQLGRAREQVRDELDRQRAFYGAPPLSRLAFEATVVLVDDGLATGLTMRSAIALARRHGASEVIVAVPCASSDAAGRFASEADRFVCPVVDAAFMAVGAYYDEFAAVADQEVLATLERAGHAPGATARQPRADGER
jgi:putative phosphoribosyl transferase